MTTRALILEPGASGFAVGSLPLQADAWTATPEHRVRAVEDFALGKPDESIMPNYPGARPSGSFVVYHGQVYPVRPSAGGCGWAVTDDGTTAREVDLDVWLVLHGQAVLEHRLAVLGYGSNLNPGEIEQFTAAGSTVVLRALVVGAASAYCTTRRSDGQFPAGLVSVDESHVEVHGVVLIDPLRTGDLDAKEGARIENPYYRRGTARGTTHPVEVVLENGTRVAGSLPVYLQARRAIACRGGKPLLLANLDQQSFDAQQASDPIDETRDHGFEFAEVEVLTNLQTEPIPVFVYGTLRPGESRFLQIEHGVASYESATFAGRRIDTGQDYPGLVLSDRRERVDGVLLRPSASGVGAWMQLLDRIEGHPDLFGRILSRVADGRLAWVYEWKGERN